MLFNTVTCELGKNVTYALPTGSIVGPTGWTYKYSTCSCNPLWMSLAAESREGLSDIARMLSTGSIRNSESQVSQIQSTEFDTTINATGLLVCADTDTRLMRIERHLNEYRSAVLGYPSCGYFSRPSTSKWDSMISTGVRAALLRCDTVCIFGNVQQSVLYIDGFAISMNHIRPFRVRVKEVLSSRFENTKVDAYHVSKRGNRPNASVHSSGVQDVLDMLTAQTKDTDYVITKLTPLTSETCPLSDESYLASGETPSSASRCVHKDRDTQTVGYLTYNQIVYPYDLQTEYMLFVPRLSPGTTPSSSTAKFAVKIEGAKSYNGIVYPARNTLPFDFYESVCDGGNFWESVGRLLYNLFGHTFNLCVSSRLPPVPNMYSCPRQENAVCGELSNLVDAYQSCYR